jgi:hypothetical protein
MQIDLVCSFFEPEPASTGRPCIEHDCVEHNFDEKCDLHHVYGLLPIGSFSLIRSGNDAMYKSILVSGFLTLSVVTLSPAANGIFGEIEIEAATRIEKSAGVWLDGQYVGFVRDLNGKGRLVTPPGEHELLFQLAGFEPLERSVVVDPGEHVEFQVAMQAAADVEYPDRNDTARVRIDVKPEDAAIFVDGRFVGHVDQFNGRRGMRLAEGTYKLTIALPGYRSFESELAVRAGQEYEIKTDLLDGDFEDQVSELTARNKPE